MGGLVIGPTNAAILWAAPQLQMDPSCAFHYPATNSAEGTAAHPEAAGPADTEHDTVCMTQYACAGERRSREADALSSQVRTWTN
jgi:hypothetical protein